MVANYLDKIFNAFFRISYLNEQCFCLYTYNKRGKVI